ncbi:MAG: hypothetical protein OXG44_07280, partial [Gammaproteobacteria bacterium]|nr:hypothetical protein [Gammaproteobacteria bacterium]
VQLRVLISEGGCAADTNLVGNDGDLGNPALRIFDADLAGAVDACRDEFGLSTPESGGSPAGFADGEFVDRLWELVESRDLGDAVRRRLAPLRRITR